MVRLTAFRNMHGRDEGGWSYGAVRAGLVVYGALGLLSLPLAVAARVQWLRAVSVDFASDATRDAYHLRAGLFFAARAVGDVGVVLAFVAGLVWLHRVWSARCRKSSTSPGAAVAWTLVPVWGFWKVHGFLHEIARRARVDETARIDRWWWLTGVHIVVRVLVATVHVVGWGHVADSILQAAVAFAGFRMMGALHAGLSTPRAGRTSSANEGVQSD